MASFVSANLWVLGALSVVLLTCPAQALDAKLELAVDRATVVRAPDNTATIVIGNPLIADATTQKNGVLVITGKSFGSTNIMLLDATGAVLSETVVSVGLGRQDGMMVVQRGGKRESFACNPRCEPVLAVGDNPETFSQTASQITQRGGLSAGRTE